MESGSSGVRGTEGARPDLSNAVRRDALLDERSQRGLLIAVLGEIGVDDRPDLLKRWLAVVVSGAVGVFEAGEVELVVHDALGDELCFEGRNLCISAFAQHLAVFIGDRRERLLNKSAVLCGGGVVRLAHSGCRWWLEGAVKRRVARYGTNVARERRCRETEGDDGVGVGDALSGR
jgi:hypothetical protein